MHVYLDQVFQLHKEDNCHWQRCLTNSALTMDSDRLHSSRPQALVSRNLAIIGAIVVAEPLSATLLFPFVYLMVRDFRTVNEKQIGFWAGLTNSLPQVCRPSSLMTGLLKSQPLLFSFPKCSQQRFGEWHQTDLV